MMQALRYAGYGGGAAGLKRALGIPARPRVYRTPESFHEELPVPTPKKEQVLIKLEAASINPVDWKIQKGMLRPILPRKFPFIPGKCWKYSEVDCSLFMCAFPSG
ncbi:hypothetical protein ACLOJK_022535 [Asimina triloba]